MNNNNKNGILLSVASPYFLREDNIFNVLRGMSTIGIMALGQTMVIITGGIDLSVGGRDMNQCNRSHPRRLVLQH